MTKPFLSGSDIPAGRRTKHTDLGFRIAAYMKLDVLPQYVQLQLKLSRRVDWQDEILEYYEGSGEIAILGLGEDW
jgi:hypothetical protein